MHVSFIFSALIACVAAGADFPDIPSDLTTPVQQRLAVNGPNSMSVGWNTYMQLDQPCVQYGTAPDKLTLQNCSTSSETYHTSRTWSNAVSLDNLKPGTTYYYKINSTNSEVEHFVSPRTAGDKTAFTMAVVIDLGVYGEDGFTLENDELKRKRDIVPTIQPSLNHTTIGSLAEKIDDYEFVVHPGDFAYADDWLLRPKKLLHPENAYEAILEQFFDQLAPIAGRKPYMASPGNHEAVCGEGPDLTRVICAEGQRNFTDFNNRFGRTMPTAFPSTSNDTKAVVNANKAKVLAHPPFYFSFEYGMVHVVMFDTETDFDHAPDSEHGSQNLGPNGPFGYQNQQLDFLEADLASVDRKVTPWLVVAGHRPWYTTDDTACKVCQDAFEQVFYKYGVDLVITGHVHNSQRFLPVYKNVADPNGMKDPKAPMYIIAGGAGNIEGLSKIGKKPPFNAFAYADHFSYAMVKFTDINNLQVDFIRSATGEVLDTSVLYKSHTQQFVVQ